MRKWAVLLLLAGSAWPALAAKSISVGQLELLLGTLHGKSDSKVAGELSDLELTERVSSPRLAHWEKDFPGPRTHEALIKLVDLAAFLEPPADDIVPIPGPDNETQERMLELAADYVKTSITRLPNFLAMRESTQFEDSPAQQGSADAMPIMAGRAARSSRSSGPTVTGTEYRSLHSTGTTSAEVAYRDGREVHVGDADKGKKENQPTKSLTTVGEFGPILSVVLGDAPRNQIAWQRWEKGAGEPVAVYRYVVSPEQSSYMVGIPTEAGKIAQIYPGYHGELAIDPATGDILRISVVAEMPPPYMAMWTAIQVEYAPVMIGEQTYTCPVHGIAFVKIPVAHSPAAQGTAAQVQTQLNDVAFMQYHLFRSQSRIVTGDSGEGDKPADAATPPLQNSTSATPPPHQP